MQDGSYNLHPIIVCIGFQSTLAQLERNLLVLRNFVYKSFLNFVMYIMYFSQLVSNTGHILNIRVVLGLMRESSAREHEWRE